MVGCALGILWVVSASAAQPDANIPQLRRHGGATQLFVDGQPFLCLAGELHNSSASSLEYMTSIWPRLERMNLNTVIAPVSWELIEPAEGQFDFALVDGLIRDARAHQMRLVFLWFGSWKNGLSSYPPLWVKTDPVRFPLAQDGKGQALDILATFGEATLKADAAAFAALLRYVRKVDGVDHTVLAVQVQNEVGVRGDSRDRSAPANQAFAAPVPAELMDFLVKRGSSLVPELRQQWEAAGRKTAGTWAEVFGDGVATDEIFMAWHYARFVGRIAAAGKAEYPIPMFANCWLDQPGTPNPGDYPSGGPLAHLLDIWQAGAPALDLLAPDLYVGEFAERCQKFTRAGNPLFIPETNSGERAGVSALYAFGRHDAICFSPFGIEGFFFGAPPPAADKDTPDTSPLAQTYAALRKLAPLVLAHQGKGTMTAVLLGKGALDESLTQQEVKLGDYALTVRLGRRGFGPPADAPAAAPGGAGATPPSGSWGGLIIATAPDEFVLLTSGISVTFNHVSKPGQTWVASVDEGTFSGDQWIRGRRLNGDQTDHNRDGSRALMPYRIVRVKLYQRP
jgi:beta-galactosidase GanA